MMTVCTLNALILAPEASIEHLMMRARKISSLSAFLEDAVVDNIDEDYDRLLQHLRDSAKEAEGSTATKRLLFYETLELIRQRGPARAAGNYQLTSELAKRCR
ncbi:hypothetical protein ANCCAN_27311 [Ancylostoma caninum]|uniref:Uncharacterized protein n=1 Tax=Ancylostoma caninum TaxID=29170 RepID=A0A368F4C1_ANCCA|nr:hypothetical protein ANCCAN_27311 [Ancylostoma caninum]